jgi:hypothetical protein
LQDTEFKPQYHQKKKKNPNIYYVNQVWWNTIVIPALERLRQKDCMFKASLGYMVRHFPPKKMLGMVAHTYNFSTWEGCRHGSTYCNPSYLGNENPEDYGLSTTQGKI